MSKHCRFHCRADSRSWHLAFELKPGNTAERIPKLDIGTRMDNTPNTGPAPKPPPPQADPLTPEELSELHQRASRFRHQAQQREHPAGAKARPDHRTALYGEGGLREGPGLPGADQTRAAGGGRGANLQPRWRSPAGRAPRSGADLVPSLAPSKWWVVAR